MQPYPGLQPYKEEDANLFFGRDAERAILSDKILANKLTLLFAATGVGKSSLLQAAIMPELKTSERGKLDIVYYNDWVASPRSELKKAIFSTLQQNAKLDTDFTLDENVSLSIFLQVSATFSSEPLVIILDQFEEFFQYQRYSEEFIPFIAELSDSIRDQHTTVVFLVSMREDFALELNAFRGYLPMMLFDNCYRLEKLTTAKAEVAIRKPVENTQVGFKYDDGLVTLILQDLSEQEREARIGAQKLVIPENATNYVEAPSVQIVCTQLWDLEKDNPQKVIRQKTYTDYGGARGFINTYFDRVISRFSSIEKRIASKAFDHLVTPRGTKMAYPTKELSAKIHESEEELRHVLRKLDKARVIRSQSRKGIVWYELYHDTFSSVITQWNSAYKFRERTKYWLKRVGMAFVIFILCFISYDIYINLNHSYVRLSTKTISNQIELYRGNTKSWDIFKLQKYIAETPYERNQIEPDKRFTIKPISSQDQLYPELISHLSLVERISEDWKTGKISKALELADKTLNGDDITRTQPVINLLATFRSQKAFDVLKRHLLLSKDSYIRKQIVNALSSSQFDGTEDCLIKLLQDTDTQICQSSASALGVLGNKKAVPDLINILQNESPEIQQSTAKALGKLGSRDAIEPLKFLLHADDTATRIVAIEALGQLGGVELVPPLQKLSSDTDWEVRQSIAEGLGKIGSFEAITTLVVLLRDENVNVQNQAATSLYQISLNDKNLTHLSESQIVPILVDFLKEQIQEEQIELTNIISSSNGGVFPLLTRFDTTEAIKELLPLLNHPSSGIRRDAAYVMGQLNNIEVVEPLVKLLGDQNLSVRATTIQSLQQLSKDNSDILPFLQRDVIIDLLVDYLKKQIKDQEIKGHDSRYPYYSPYRSDFQTVTSFLMEINKDKTITALIELLHDQDSAMRSAVAKILGEFGNDEGIPVLIQLFQDEDEEVRCNAALATAEIDHDDAIPHLLQLLNDKNSTVRKCAVEALGKLHRIGTVQPLLEMLQEQNPELKHTVVAALGEFDNSRLIPYFLELLQEQDMRIRYEAANRLSEFGDDVTIEYLLPFLGRQYSYWRQTKGGSYYYHDLRTEIVDSLSQLGCNFVVEPLLNLALETKQEDFLPFSGVYSEFQTIDAIAQLHRSKAINLLSAILKQNQSPYYAKEAVKVMGDLGWDKAKDFLLELLKNSTPYTQGEIALSLAKLSDFDALDYLKKLYNEYDNVPQETNTQMAIAAAMLSLGSNDGLFFLDTQSRNHRNRLEVARVLGEAPSLQGNQILLSMFDTTDFEDFEVKKQVIESLGKAKAIEALPQLYGLLEHSPHPLFKKREAYQIYKTTVIAIGNIASVESVPILRKIALNTDEYITVRIAAIQGLGNIGTERAVAALLEVLNDANEHYHFKVIMALGETRSERALPKLLDMLHHQNENRIEWRQIRDETPDTSNDEEMKQWRERQAAVTPLHYLEFELAHSISMIDPENEGIKLLHHNLAKVREGAWMGLADLPLTKEKPFELIDGLAAINSIKRLYYARKESEEPLLKHAAYRAIDEILITIEAYGGRTEMQMLNSFLPEILDDEGIRTRVEWTINRLQE